MEPPNPAAQQLILKQQQQLLAALSTFQKNIHPAKSFTSRTREPYFKQDTAEWFREQVLLKIQYGQTVYVRVTPGQNLATIGVLLSQSRKYLFTMLDDDGHWQRVWEMTNTTIDRTIVPHGYKFYPKININIALQIVTPCDFYNDLSSYLISLEGIPAGQAIFERAGLNLPVEDITKLDGMLSQYNEMLTYAVSKERISVINHPSPI